MTKLQRSLTLLISITLFLLAPPVLAGSKDEHKALQQQIEELQKGQDEIKKELGELKTLLQRSNRPAPSRGQQPFEPTDTDVAGAVFLGSKDSPVTLIEYSDYHCPFCKRHATQVMPQLIEKYVDTGKVRFVMREYPIERLHPRSVAAAEAVLCAGAQGEYWEMHDALFADQKSTSDEHFQQLAAEMGLDTGAFTQCMADDTFMPQIKKDIAEAQRLGISGTPSFVVGLTDPDNPDEVHLTKFIRGAQALPAFSAAIDELLQKAEGGD